MSEGLIGALARRRALHTAHRSYLPKMLDRREVLDLLRSEETRANVAHTVYAMTACQPTEADAIAEAVLRMLAGSDE